MNLISVVDTESVEGEVGNLWDSAVGNSQKTGSWNGSLGNNWGSGSILDWGSDWGGSILDWSSDWGSVVGWGSVGGWSVGNSWADTESWVDHTGIVLADAGESGVNSLWNPHTNIIILIYTPEEFRIPILFSKAQNLALGGDGAESSVSQSTDSLFGLSSNMGAVVDNTGASGGNNSKNNDGL